MHSFPAFVRGLFLLLAAGSFAAARAQNVGIGTTSPTQTLDVNGTLRVRDLRGDGLRLPQVLPDGTFGPGAQPFETSPAGSVASLVGDAAVQYPPHAIAVAGSVAYVVSYPAGGNGTLELFDISNPASPVLLSATDRPAIIKPTAIAVSGTTAYIVAQNTATSGTLLLYDVSNPVSPVRLNSGNTGIAGLPTSLAVSGSTVLVTAQTSGGNGSLTLFDASDPARPSRLGQPTGTRTGANPVAVTVSGTTAYVVSQNTAGAGLLQLFDLSNPASAQLPLLNPATAGGTSGGTATDAQPTALAVRGTTAYVVTQASSTAGTLQVFALSNPVSPVLLNASRPGASTGGTPTAPQPSGLSVSGTTAYVVSASAATQPGRPSFAGRFQLFGVSNPAQPVLLSNTPLLANQTNSMASADAYVAVSGTTAYVAHANERATAGVLQVFGGQVGQGQVVTVNPDGSLASVTVNALGDNLGNHTATQNLQLGAHQLVGNGGSQGVSVGSSGNVGIGTATPRQKLDVNGSLAVSGDCFLSGNVAVGFVATPGQQVELGGRVAPTLLLHSNANDQSVGGSLQFRESSTDYGWNLRHNTGGSEGGSANDRLILERVNAAAASPTMAWDQNTGNVGIGTIAPSVALDVVGNVRCSGLTQTSDARFKQHVRPLAGALAAVQALRGVRYTWNALGVRYGGTAGAEQVGFLAQELEKIYPELVSTDAQGYKAVNYAQLTPVLLEALKELAARNDALQSRVADQQARLSSFEERLRALETGGGQARR